MPVREIDTAEEEELNNLSLGWNRYEQAVFLRRPADFLADIGRARIISSSEGSSPQSVAVMREKAESFADHIRCIAGACEEDCTSALEHVNYWLTPCMHSLPPRHFEKTHKALVEGGMPRSAWTRTATAGFFAGLSQALADDIAALVSATCEPAATQ